MSFFKYPYQSNVIKQIYGDKFINNKYTTTTDVEYYYQYNSKYNNCIEVPDLLTIVSSYHGFTSYPLFVDRATCLPQDISKIRFPESIYKEHSAYFKLVNDKDIDWDNAYLRYSGDYQTCNPEQPIEYSEFVVQKGNDNNIQLITNDKTSNEYIFSRGLCSYINNTYELMNIIDYLFIRLKTLKFLFNVVKESLQNT